jgi:hypothetical protein
MYTLLSGKNKYKIQLYYQFERVYGLRLGFGNYFPEPRQIVQLSRPDRKLFKSYPMDCDA